MEHLYCVYICGNFDPNETKCNEYQLHFMILSAPPKFRPLMPMLNCAKMFLNEEPIIKKLNISSSQNIHLTINIAIMLALQ